SHLQGPSARVPFEIQLDAQIAKGYFQRSDLHDPSGSWVDYLPSAGDHEDELHKLFALYLTAFAKTYDGTDKQTDPRENLCALPSVDQLKADNPELQGILDAYKDHKPTLEAALQRYPGYTELLKRFDGLEDKLGKADKLKYTLFDYEGKVPGFDADF